MQMRWIKEVWYVDYEISFKNIGVTVTACCRCGNSHYEGIYIRRMLCRWLCCMVVWYLLYSFNHI